MALFLESGTTTINMTYLGCAVNELAETEDVIIHEYLLADGTFLTRYHGDEKAAPDGNKPRTIKLSGEFALRELTSSGAVDGPGLAEWNKVRTLIGKEVKIHHTKNPKISDAVSVGDAYDGVYLIKRINPIRRESIGIKFMLFRWSIDLIETMPKPEDSSDDDDTGDGPPAPAPAPNS